MTTEKGTDAALPAVAIWSADADAARRFAEILAAADLEVAAIVDSEQEALNLEPAPDVVILHTSGATKRGLLVRRLRARLDDVHVVAVGASARGHEVRSALEAGADGFVFEEEAQTTLALTVRVACIGQIAVPRQQRRQLGRPTLSQREKQILGLVVMGFMNCEIADQLYLAESTVKSHLSSAFAKLGVRSRNEAVDLILRGEDGLGRGILAITGDAAAGTAVPSAA